MYSTQVTDNAVVALQQAVTTISEAVLSQRKRKRGISHLPESDHNITATQLNVRDLDFAGNPRLQSSLGGHVEGTKPASPAVPNPDQKLSAAPSGAVQGRIGRQQAYSSTKQSLEKWTDTVNSIRSAEQLVFPIEKASSNWGGKYNLETSFPLEKKISGALQGTQDPSIKTKRHGSAGTRKSCARDIQLKTSQLRIQRELLLRQVAKAKRLKKIKSKSYRRTLKKTQQKAARRILQGSYIQEESNSETNREESQAANETQNASSSLASPPRDRPGSQKVFDDTAIPELRSKAEMRESRLFAMKFMEAGQKCAAITDSCMGQSENNNPFSGRRMFHDGLRIPGPMKSTEAILNTTSKLNRDFLPLCETQQGHPAPSLSTDNTNPWLHHSATISEGLEDSTSIVLRGDPGNGIPGLSETAATLKPVVHTDAPVSYIAQALTPNQISHPPVSRDSIGVLESNLQPELLARAFASDHVLQYTTEEKTPNHSSSDQAIRSGSLVGWGDWGHAGRKCPRKNLPKKLVDHKAHAQKIVVNNRFCKKGSKYLATNLPYPFETREQYERSLRFPIGQEWSTKHIHQRLSAPKVIVKGGVALNPLS